MTSSLHELLEQCRVLRRQGNFAEARAQIEAARQDARLPAGQLDLLAWEHDAAWWSPIRAGICQLTRRDADDAAFLRQLWSDAAFVHQFHRQAGPLPHDDAQLAAILDDEAHSLLSESHALHWVVRDRSRRPWGLLSLSEVSLPQKRAEVLLGMLPDAPQGLSTAAMLVLFQFFFKVIGFHKLTSFIYEDNPRSLKSTLHLGFRQEGLLREHIRDPRSGDFVHLIQTGLLAADAFTPANLRLMERLLRD